MTVEVMAEAVRLTQGRAQLEASGNVNLENVRRIAETGVDFIFGGRADPFRQNLRCFVRCRLMEIFDLLQEPNWRRAVPLNQGSFPFVHFVYFVFNLVQEFYW